MMEENTRIYTVFTSSGVQHFEAKHIRPLTNDDLMAALRRECEGVEFVIGSATHDIGRIKGEFDGVLIFGGLRDYSMALTGLPTIAVYNFPEFLHIPYELFLSRGRILTACLDRAGACSSSISSAMFKDLVEKIKLIQVLKKMSESRILAVTDSPYVNVIHGDLKNVYEGDIRQKPPEEYNRIFTKAVEESLGTKITKIGTDEVASDEDIQNIDEDKAKRIARMWIEEARGMRDTLESEVVKSAKMYLAMRILMEKYDATAIATHIRSLVKNPRPEDMIWPSLGDSELQKQGIVACCQAHINVVLTHMLAQYAFGRPSMMGDFTIEPFNGVGIVMHCGAPWNLWGDDRRTPYIIRDHAERRVREHSVPGCGACSEVLYPSGEPVTIWRINVLDRTIYLHTGTTVDGYSLYKDFDYLMCRTKLVARIDAEKVQRHIYQDKRGVHRTATLGDFRRRIKDLGTLMGFKVVEEDR